MPHAAIHRRRGAKPQNRAALVEAVNRALIGVLGVAEDTHPVRLTEYDADSFLIPGSCSADFTLVEATLFAGRTPETKETLFKAIVANISALGVAENDIRTVIYDVPRDNWGLEGGVPASQVDLGFKVEI